VAWDSQEGEERVTSRLQEEDPRWLRTWEMNIEKMENRKNRQGLFGTVQNQEE